MSTIAPEAPPVADEQKEKVEIPPGLQLELFQGRKVTKIEVSVTGKVTLNLENPADLETWKRLRLGKELALNVAGIVRNHNSRIARDKDGYATDTIQTAVLAVDGVAIDPSWQPSA